MKEIYKNLKYIREEMGLSQNAFAEKIGYNVSNVNRWESGANGISLEVAYDIAQKLNIPINKLVSDELRLDKIKEPDNEITREEFNEIISGLLNKCINMTEEDKKYYKRVLDIKDKE